MPPKKSKNKIKNYKPFVSVCTPTFNRRPFIESMIKCFNHQDYPKDRMEWIIIDDGTDKIGDLVAQLPNVKYFPYDKKMPLGEKRNIMHEKSKGSILVYMDDDDYYPPTRVSHAVERLRANPDALCAGSSEMYIYFKHVNKMYQFGPYGPKHATAGTFAFKRELLKDHSYENHASLAEEKAFLKNYTVPFVQLDPLHSILVFSHDHNTFDKKKLLYNANLNFVKESPKTVDMFIKDADMKDFYMNKIEKLLEKYAPGRPEMKPDVLKQMLEIEQERKKQLLELNTQAQAQNQNQNQIVFQQGNNPPQTLTMEQVVQILQDQKNQIDYLLNQIKGKDIEIEVLTKQLNI
jgi:glycosyltransferase involved in cell wall biosynthesis